jgi:arylsulfatase A-like enzyme
VAVAADQPAVTALRALALVVAGCAAAAASGCRREEPAASRRPNVLLVSIDTLRADRLGAYGHDRPTSPTFDTRLAAAGVLFERAISQSPKTTPSHLTMLTGLAPCAHRVGMWTDEHPPRALAPSVRTLAEELRDAGYRTAAFTAGGHVHASRGFGRGFDVYEHDRPLERTLAWLADHGDEPFFVFFHTYEVHDPYTPPRRLRQRFAPDLPAPLHAVVDRIRRQPRGWEEAHRAFWAAVDARDPAHVQAVASLYDAGIRRMDDRTLTPLLEALDHAGVAEHTLVVFTSDHGDAFGEHGVFLHDDVHLGTVHVPLVLRLPGVLPAGRRVEAPVGVLDVMPTVLAVLGLPVPAGVQGRSLLPQIRDDDATSAPPVVSEYLAPDGTVVARSIRTPSLSLVRGASGDRLYDLGADARERHDLAATRPGDLAVLETMLGTWEQRCAPLAAAHPPAFAAAEPDAETRAGLRALGYLP